MKRLIILAVLLSGCAPIGQKPNFFNYLLPFDADQRVQYNFDQYVAAHPELDEQTKVDIKARRVDLQNMKAYEEQRPKFEAIRDEAETYTCKGAECGDAWSRAQVWINRHSKMKIQIANDTLLETYGGDYVTYAFSSTKEPLGRGEYKISLEVSCKEGGVCAPPFPQELRRAFIHFVRTGADVIPDIAWPGIR